MFDVNLGYIFPPPLFADVMYGITHEENRKNQGKANLTPTVKETGEIFGLSRAALLDII